MYIYTTSLENPSYFSGNKPSHFRVKLPKTLRRTQGHQWRMALLDICIPEFSDKYTTEYITVNCNICEESIDNTTLKPILNRLYTKQMTHGRVVTCDNPRYVSVTVSVLDTLDINLTDSQGGQPSFAKGNVSCTLHLIEEEE